MQQIHRKSKLIETYCVLLIDFASIVISYLLAMFIRFGTIRNADRLSLHYNVCMYMMLFCLLYSVLIDWNRHFFWKRLLYRICSGYKIRHYNVDCGRLSVVLNEGR